MFQIRRLPFRKLISYKLQRKITKRNCSTQDLFPDNPDQIKYDEKVAIINGGASGIGLAIAKEFLENGMQCLAIIDIDKAKGEEVAEQLTSKYGEDSVLFFPADVVNSKALDKAYRQVIQFYDVPHIVINSAGIMDDTAWERQLQTNLAGCAVGTLLGMQYMSKTSNGNGGIVVNIASILGIIPSTGCPLHTMTQFGVCGFSKAMGLGSHFQRTGVKVIAYCPGLTQTNLLNEAPKHAINENFAQEFFDELAGTELLKPEFVAKGLVEVLGEAKPGSVWVAESGLKPFEIAYPGSEFKKVKETENTSQGLGPGQNQDEAVAHVE